MTQAATISLPQLKRALDIYWRHAWPRNEDAKPVWVRKPLQSILATFNDESGVTPHACRRFALRLGNHLYPHMKLAIEQCVFGGGYYFLADCHDSDIVPLGDDAQAWHELRARNFEVKLNIEADWEHAGLPTFRTSSRQATGEFALPDRNTPLKRRILIVDDEPANAELTGAMLRADGFGTHTVASGADALLSVSEHLPDLVVSDYEMPGLTGRDVAARLKSDKATRRIPVLICTYAAVDARDLRPADALLRRPFSREDLCSTVGRLLDAGDDA